MPERCCCPTNNPAEICFEEDICGFVISGCKGQCPLMTVYEGEVPKPCPTPPRPEKKPNSTSLIRNDQRWHVSFEWKQDGPISELMVGQWEVCVFLHRIDELKVIKQCVTIPHEAKCGYCYSATIEFAAGSVPDGLYEIYGSIGFEVPGHGSAAISGMAYGPVLKVYTPR